jgi:5-methylcytosine-specific restriction protein A
MAWSVPTYSAAVRQAARIPYDALRPSAPRRGYGRKWQAYAKNFLRVHPFCACGCGRASECVDHIKAVSGPGDPLFWESSNHQALSNACHSRKTVLEDGGFGRPRKKPGNGRSRRS